MTGTYLVYLVDKSQNSCLCYSHHPRKNKKKCSHYMFWIIVHLGQMGFPLVPLQYEITLQESEFLVNFIQETHNMDANRARCKLTYKIVPLLTCLCWWDTSQQFKFEIHGCAGGLSFFFWDLGAISGFLLRCSARRWYKSRHWCAGLKIRQLNVRPVDQQIFAKYSTDETTNWYPLIIIRQALIRKYKNISWWRI